LKETLYGHLPVFAQNWACTWAGRRRWQARFTPHFHQTLAEFEQSIHGPLERLHQSQRHRLARLVNRAREYTRHYRALDLPPPVVTGDAADAIRATLETIPVLEKSTYRSAPESFIAWDIPRRRLLRGKTSGTTGTALPLWYTSKALAEEYAVLWRQRRRLGLTLRDPHLSFGGQLLVPLRQSGPPYWRKNHYARQILFSIYHISPETLPAYVDAIHAFPARYVQGYPSSLHLVSRAMLEQDRPLPPGRLAAVFPSSESLLAFQRDAIERAFAAPVLDRYGTSEFAASMTACSEGLLHVDMEYCIVEVEVQESTDEWERGPLLVTGLANAATPFLRYRIGDIGTRLKRPCRCGRPGDVFSDVDGRIEDIVVTPEGRRVGRLDHIFKQQLDVSEAQILQDTKEAIEVRVVPGPSWSQGSERNLLKEIHARLGEAIRVELRVVSSIPREPNGKFRAVKSHVDEV
jgi:phenylacetate-CoA ligase